MSTPSLPDHPVPPPIHRRAACRAPVAVCVFLLLLCALWASLPRIAHYAAAQAARALGVPDLQLEIRGISPWSLDLGTVSPGPNSGLSAQAVYVDFSPTGLSRGRVDRLRVMGLDITVSQSDSGWEISGLPKANATQSGSTDPFFFPVLDQFHIAGRLKLADTTIDLPYVLDGSLAQSGQLLIDAGIHVAGQKIALTLDANLIDTALTATVTLPPSSLAALASLAPGLDLPLAGQIQAAAGLRLPGPDQPFQAHARLGLDSVRTALSGINIEQNGSLEADLAWNQGLDLNFSPLLLHAPLPVTIQIQDVSVDLQSRQVGFAWAVSLDSLPALTLAAAARLNGQTVIQQTAAGWTAKTRGSLEALRVHPATEPLLQVDLDPTAINVDLTANSKGATLNASLALGRLRLTRDTLRADLSGLALNATATADNQAGVRGSVLLSGGRLEATHSGASLTANTIGGQADVHLGPEAMVNATISTSLRARTADLTAGVNLRLPLAWPTPSTTAGSLDVDLRRDGMELAKISTRLEQNLRGLAVRGNLSLLPVTVRGAVTGQLDLLRPASSWVEVKTAQDITLPGNLKGFTPALGGISGQGKLEATARLQLDRGIPEVPLTLRLSNLNINHSQSKTVLNGLTLGLAFNDLLTTRSEPDQRITFKRLQLGSVTLDNGDIRYQIEAPHSVLVEGCTMDWAGGHIGTHAFRLNPAVEDYMVTLYCDRVELARALGQLGMTQAQGGGTANGRIPLRYSDGSLTFDKGFLYSTPGEKGVLRIEGTEILTAGVPPGSPQYAQLDLASEALKDFSYEWAKISMNTQDKELVVALELDGKPAKPLPFTYSRDIGGFARVSANSPGSVFQGIRLDVNFRLPLDQLLQYRQLLDLMKQ